MGLPMKRDQAANGACSRGEPALRVLLVDRYTMAWRVVIAGGGRHCSSSMRSSAAHIAELRGTETEKRAPRARQSESRSMR